MSGTSKLYNLSIGYIFSDPDNNPDKVSGYRVIKRLQWRVPTTIPTKCRDSGPICPRTAYCAKNRTILARYVFLVAQAKSIA